MTFDPQANTFSLPNARLLAQAAAIAYRPEIECRAWAAASGLDAGSLDFFDHRDTQGFVVQNEDAIIVAFRGTQPGRPMDWFIDFGAIHRSFDHPIGTVHGGFYDALKAVWGMALPDARRILPERLRSRGNRSVWITGHSLGGALAELCAAQAALVETIPIQGVYTFGQPRVGNDAFAKAVNDALGSRIHRIVNNRDIVPRVPLFGMRFCHYGNMRFFEDGGGETETASAVETLAVAMKFFAGSFDVALLGQAADLAKGVASQLLGHDLTEQQEEAFKERARELLKGGVENIDDHNMVKHYLKRVGTSLPALELG
jgi:triacylglycerol lipase